MRVCSSPDVGSITLIDSRDIAAVAERVLIRDGHDRRAYVLTGPEALSYAELAERYSRALGHEVRWRERTLEETRQALVAAGLPPALARGFAEIMGGYRRGGEYARVSPAVEALLGRPPRSFDAFVAERFATRPPVPVTRAA